MADSKQKDASSPSTSSIAFELFGPKETPSMAASSASIFAAVFAPPPSRMVGSENVRNPYDQQQTIEPCHYSSSIFYGGQEFYSTSPPNTQPQYKKYGGVDEPEGASRGDWWQGSLYY